MHEEKLNINDGLIQSSWDDMESILNREMPVRKRRRAGLLIALLALLFLACVAIIYSMVSGDQQIPESPEAQSQQTDRQIVSEDPAEEYHSDELETRSELAVVAPIDNAERDEQYSSEHIELAKQPTKETYRQTLNKNEKEPELASVNQEMGLHSRDDENAQSTIKSHETIEDNNAGNNPITVDSKISEAHHIADRQEFKPDIMALLDKIPASISVLEYVRQFKYPVSPYLVIENNRVAIPSILDRGLWTYGSITSYEPEIISGFDLGLSYDHEISKSFGVQLLAGVSSTKLLWDEGRANLLSRFGSGFSLEQSQDPTSLGEENVNSPTRQIYFQDYLALISSAWFLETGVVVTKSFGKWHVSAGPKFYYTISAINDTELGMQTVSSHYLTDNDYINRFSIGFLTRFSFDLGHDLRAHVSYNLGLSNLYRNLDTPPIGFQPNAEFVSQSAVQLKKSHISFGIMLKIK